MNITRADEIKNSVQEVYESVRGIFEKYMDKDAALGLNEDGWKSIAQKIGDGYKTLENAEEQALFIDELRNSSLGDSLNKAGLTSAINRSILSAEKSDINKDSKFYADAMVNAFARGADLSDIYGKMSGLSLKEKEQAVKIAAECIPSGPRRVDFTNKCSEYMLRQYMRAAVELSKTDKPQAETNKAFADIIANVPVDRRGEFMANLSCRMSDGHFKDENFYTLSKATENFNKSQADHLTGVFNLAGPDGRGDAARMHIQEMAAVFDNPRLSEDEAVKRFDAMAENMDPCLMQAEINFIEAELSDEGQKRLAAAIDNHNKAFSTCYEGRGVICDREKAKKFFDASWESTMSKCRASAKAYQDWAGRNPNASKFYKALELIEKVSNATRLFFNNRLMVQGRPQSLIDTIDRSYSHSNFGFVEEEQKAAEKGQERAEEKATDETEKWHETEADKEAKAYWEAHQDEKKEFRDDIYSVVKDSVKDVAVEMSEAILEGKNIEKTVEEYRNVMAAISGMQGIGEKSELYGILGDELAKNLGLGDKIETGRTGVLIKLDAARATKEGFDKQTVGNWIQAAFERRKIREAGKEEAKDEKKSEKKQEEKEEKAKDKDEANDKKTTDALKKAEEERNKEDAAKYAEILRKAKEVQERHRKEDLEKAKNAGKADGPGASKFKEAERIADKVAALASMRRRSPEANMNAIAKWARGNKKEAEVLKKHIENGVSLEDKCGLEDEKIKIALQAGLDDSGRDIPEVIKELEEDAELMKNVIYAQEDHSEDEEEETYQPFGRFGDEER